MIGWARRRDRRGRSARSGAAVAPLSPGTGVAV